MSASGGDMITIDCGEGIQLGTSSETATDFYFVIPPVKFSQGITITATDVDGKVFEKSTKASFSILRNKIQNLPAVKYEGVRKGNITFADAYFKAYCVENFDTNGDGEISYAEAENVTVMDCRDRSITSMNEIKYFTSLTWLCCANNQIASIDVSDNSKLIELDCTNNLLENIDVGSNISLKVLRLYGNMLTCLDVNKNTLLTTLDCSVNKLTNLNINNNTALYSLGCWHNQLTNLDISNNVALRKLNCNENNITILDVGNNVALTYLNVYGNQLKSLDVCKNIALQRLYCFRNQLSDLDVSNNSKLYKLECQDNPYLTEIWLKKEQTISSFTYDSAVATIKYKDIIYFADDNFKVYCVENFDTNGDGEISYTEAEVVKEISCDGRSISSMDEIKYFTSLTSLWCNSNRLTNLDVSNNLSLTGLSCFSNLLTSLIISNNVALTYINCGNNQLTGLDVSQNIGLTELTCDQNKITALDLSNNLVLRK